MPNNPRIDLNTGIEATDVNVNPKAVERKQREAEERDRLAAEATEPWSRAKVERELARAAASESFGVVNGQEIRNSANLHGVDLAGLDLSGLDLSRANLHGAKLVGTNLNGARLVGANLHDADLGDAQMEDVNAVEANFHGACLCGSKVAKTHFMKANLSECCHEATSGLDIEEKPLTAAEEKKARSFMGMVRRLFGYDEDASGQARASISTEEGKVRYYGETLENANVSGMKAVCKRRKI
jgi:uncharacterized protein YjbI with pentapeptide repeats